LLEWSESLKDLYQSKRQKLLASLQRQVKQARTVKLREFLQRKVQIVTELIEGPRPQFADDDPLPSCQLAEKPEPKPMTDAELVESARYLLDNKMQHALTQAQKAALLKLPKAERRKMGCTL
jgi:hypothetical protein